MALLESALLWLADKVGGAFVGEKAKKLVPSLNKAKKEVDQARHEATTAQRALGHADKEIEILIADNDYQRELIFYLRGCLDNLESHCANQGAPVPKGFYGEAPKRKLPVQAIKAKRAK